MLILNDDSHDGGSLSIIFIHDFPGFVVTMPSSSTSFFHIREFLNGKSDPSTAPAQIPRVGPFLNLGMRQISRSFDPKTAQEMGMGIYIYNAK